MIYKAIIMTLSLAAFSAYLPAQNSSSDIDNECSKEILLAFFPEIFVEQTLRQFHVPEDKWNNIKVALHEKDKEIVKTVENKAIQMTPNPLKDPQHRQEAVKLFRDTLLEAFSTVLKSNGINDDVQIKDMLDDIQKQKAKRFSLCLEKHRDKMQKNTPPAEAEDSF